MLINWNGPIALGIAALLVVGYMTLARHHYDRGFEAHKAAVAAEIIRKNDEIELLNNSILHQETVAEGERRRAVEDAIGAQRGYCAENPAACGIAIEAAVLANGKCAPVSMASLCSVPVNVRDKLNRIR